MQKKKTAPNSHIFAQKCAFSCIQYLQRQGADPGRDGGAGGGAGVGVGADLVGPEPGVLVHRGDGPVAARGAGAVGGGQGGGALLQVPIYGIFFIKNFIIKNFL